MKFETYAHKIIFDQKPNFYQDLCKNARTRAINVCTRDEMCTRLFTTRACGSYEFKFHKDPSFRQGDIALFVTLYGLEVKMLGFFHPELQPKVK